MTTLTIMRMLPREVDPLGLVDKDGTWYLLARTPDRRRTFRVEGMPPRRLRTKDRIS